MTPCYNHVTIALDDVTRTLGALRRAVDDLKAGVSPSPNDLQAAQAWLAAANRQLAMAEAVLTHPTPAPAAGPSAN
jgi:hypothetical protein